MITEPECRSGLRTEFAFQAGAGPGVNILGSSRSRRRCRSQHYGLCRSQSKFLRDLISVNVLVVVKENGIHFRRVFSPVSSYITKVWHWVGVPSISPLMMVSKLWPMQNTVWKWQCGSEISKSMLQLWECLGNDVGNNTRHMSSKELGIERSRSFLCFFIIFTAQKCPFYQSSVSLKCPYSRWRHKHSFWPLFPRVPLSSLGPLCLSPCCIVSLCRGFVLKSKLANAREQRYLYDLG